MGIIVAIIFQISPSDAADFTDKARPGPINAPLLLAVSGVASKAAAINDTINDKGKKAPGASNIPMRPSGSSLSNNFVSRHGLTIQVQKVGRTAIADIAKLVTSLSSPPIAFDFSRSKLGPDIFLNSPIPFFLDPKKKNYRRVCKHMQ
jgi:hypothetical protein